MRSNGELGWKYISPEADVAMFKWAQDPRPGRLVLNEAAEDASRSITTLASDSDVTAMRDMEGKPMVWGKKYWSVCANPGAALDRMIDYEDNNKQKIVLNSKWHNRIHLVFVQHLITPSGYCIQYPGRSNWFDGCNTNDDVKLSNSSGSSRWDFRNSHTDS